MWLYLGGDGMVSDDLRHMASNHRPPIFPRNDALRCHHGRKVTRGGKRGRREVLHEHAEERSQHRTWPDWAAGLANPCRIAQEPCGGPESAG